MTFKKIDIYELLTPDELDQVTDILLEALAREKGIVPEVFEIETNILMERKLIDEITEVYDGLRKEIESLDLFVEEGK